MEDPGRHLQAERGLIPVPVRSFAGDAELDLPSGGGDAAEAGAAAPSFPIDHGPISLLRWLLALRGLPHEHEVVGEVQVRLQSLRHLVRVVGAGVHDAAEEGAVVGDDLVGPGHGFGAAAEARAELDGVLEGAGAEVHGHVEVAPVHHDLASHLGASLGLVRDVVEGLVAALLQRLDVGLAELELVEVEEGETVGVEPRGEGPHLVAPSRDAGDLEAHIPVVVLGGAVEARVLGVRVHVAPDLLRRVETELVEPRLVELREPRLVEGDLRVDVDVVPVTELLLEVPDEAQGALGVVHGVAAGEARAVGAGEAHLLGDSLQVVAGAHVLRGDAALVRPGAVVHAAGVADGAVEAVVVADPGDEEHELRTLRAHAAPRGEVPLEEAAAGAVAEVLGLSHDVGHARAQQEPP